MKEIKKQFSINDIEMYRQDDDVDFAHAKIYCFADKNNSHKNPISLEVLKRDAHTILGKFLVAKFDKMLSDVEGHMLDEVIIGYIDPREEVTFEEKQVDGETKTFLVVNGLISKIYATEIVEMFRKYNTRTVSCEFSCIEGETDSNGDTPILSYNMHSICVLGLKYKPSISGTEIKVMKFAEQCDKELKSNLKSFAEKRTEDLKVVNHKADKSKESIDYGDWNGDKVKHDLIKEKNYKTLAKSVCLKLEDGWEDKQITSLGYPIMNLKDGKWVYNANGLSSALGYAKQNDPTIHKKVIEIQKKLGLYKEEEMEEEKKLSESENENIVMEEENKVEETKECSEETVVECAEVVEEPKKFSLDAYADMGAILTMLENETEQYTELAKKVMCDYSVEDIVMQFVAITKECAELKEFKCNTEKAETEKKFSSIMASVKEDLDVKTFSELQEEGKVLTMEQLGAFENKVKAFAYESTRNKKDVQTNQEILVFGVPNETTNITSAKGVEDIFNKYL